MTMLRMLGLRIGAVLAVASILWLGSTVAVPSAHANGTATLFYGLVVADAHGQLPVRLQAISEAGVVCGSADVVPLDAQMGGYVMRAVTADVKAGCPSDGERVRFILLDGPIDDGVLAIPSALMRVGQVVEVHLAPAFTRSAS